VRARDGGRLDTASPAVRREVGRLSRELGETKHVGRVVDPLGDPRQGRSLIARDGRSLVIAGHLSTQDVEDEGGEAAELRSSDCTSASASRRPPPNRREDAIGGSALGSWRDSTRITCAL